jgi:SAM-dependent methyltransferase
VTEELLITKSERYRAASEALHRDTRAQDRHGANLRMLWECGLADLIRADFYGLFAFTNAAHGAFLDAGCGTGIETRNLAGRLPELRLYGVDISSVALACAVADNAGSGPRFYQSALEALPFANGVFDYIGSHEVIEHVEDPALVLSELHRVLKPSGICVIATPNGASLWVEHLRQRLARLLGRRGAPVGEDHVRPPSFWRRQFERAGLIVERRIFDGAAFEFLTYVAPACWMPLATRLLEPLRVVPIINLLVCDRVKYRLRKPGLPPTESVEPYPVCVLCRSELTLGPSAAICRRGHCFGYNPSGLIDFTALLPDGPPAPPGNTAVPAAARSRWPRRLRRYALAAGCLFYVAFFTALVPLGFALGLVHRPMQRKR